MLGTIDWEYVQCAAFANYLADREPIEVAVYLVAWHR